MSGCDELYCLNVKASVKPERRDEFLKTIEANRTTTLAEEPLAVKYVIGEDQDTPNTFHFFEQYKGKAGFEAHTKAPHFPNWEKFVGSDPFTSELDVRFYTEAACEKPTQVQDPDGKQLFCLNVTLKIKEERREEFLKCIAGNQEGTLTAEPLARTYLFGEDASTRNTFHFHERYAGKEGFEAHKAAPHFAVWEKFAGSDPFTAPPEVMFFFESP